MRHQLQEEPDQGWLARPQVRDGLRAVAAAGLAYDLVISPDQLPLVTETVTALPEVRFVLDHAGKPPIAGRSEPPAGWRRPRPAGAGGLAERGGEAVRAGHRGGLGIVDAGQLGPVMEYVLAEFGPDRTMVGSDWPVCLLAASYAEVRRRPRRSWTG